MAAQTKRGAVRGAAVASMCAIDPKRAQKIAIDVLSIKFKLLLELNPEIFLRDIKLFRNIKNILWEEFEDLEICDEDSDKWNEFIDRVNDFE